MKYWLCVHHRSYSNQTATLELDHKMSNKMIDLDETVTHTGPKGVINDWRRFKMESMDQESLPPAKKELLKQMSSPNKIKDDSRANLNRKMSVQEYELLKEEDEGCLKKYRRRCMQEMHEKLSFGPRFGGVHDLDSGEVFLEVIEKEHHSTVVVVHIYKDGVAGCEELNNCLDCLATEYPTVKFCRIDAVASGASERFSDEVLPTLLVYKAGELLGNFLACTQHLNQEFFATDVEAFLNSYGLLPEKEMPGVGDEEENDVE
ncbi:phosducin b isoform X1 [Solea solea]|uniref:phosducin b isoform X1 n=2 Tax=Solea solea TaxID=90069 RepID=UPI00272A16EB|nr:phosducin b isoform X1 [Solea solea]